MMKEQENRANIENNGHRRNRENIEIMDIEETEKNMYIADRQEADIFVRQLLNIGEAMYRSGGEISRIEDTLHRMGKKYGAEHVSVYALTSSIVVTTEFADNYSVTQNRRITRRESIDCKKMEMLNQLCRECEKNPIPVLELREKVLGILKEEPNAKRIYIGQLLAATAFTIFFGGEVQDALVAGLGACLICILQRRVRPYCSAALFFNVIVSFSTGLFVNLLSLLIPGIHVNQILIGDIMVLIPGIAITNSIRYILSGDTISSFEKLMDSLLQAFGIATGFLLALMCVGGQVTDAPSRTGSLAIIIQLLAASVGTLGFCLVFNLRARNIWIPTLGGFLGWAIYLLMRGEGANVFASVLVASLAIGVYGVIFAHIAKAPTTVLFIPACIPLIPGGNLYYSALAILSQDWEKFRENIILLALFAVGISIGLAIAVEAEKMIINIKGRKHEKSR